MAASEKEILQAQVIEAEKAQAVAEARAEAAEKNAGERIAMADSLPRKKLLRLKGQQKNLQMSACRLQNF